ncbi:MAG: 50S ribosome-binding GTPase [Desulfobacterales bacterium]|nr:50S ribosome-binding GTPase [Desulfobacterales bacterium]
MRQLFEKKINDALKSLRNHIPQVSEVLCLENRKELKSWMNIIDGKLLPRLSKGYPLTAAICGGGSSGKSTLFNSLIGKQISPTSGMAGINRRILVSVHAELLNGNDFLPILFEPFGCIPEPLKDPHELTMPGCPLYVLNRSIAENLVIIDTPDFDTGSKGTYNNRNVARQALETSDILIYIFTNANYSNRDNTNFISQILTGIGMRKCFLLYRVYPNFKNSEVLEHAMTVARNLYGNQADHYVLGIYRIDEDNAVAAGQRFMEIKPVREKDSPFMQALETIDPRKLKVELSASILSDVLVMAEDVLANARVSYDELSLYLDILQTAQSHCVHEALLHFPMNLILNRFIEIWFSTDPGYIRAMRKTGKVLELPFKVFLGAARWAGNRLVKNYKKEPSRDFNSKLEEDLLNAANNLYYSAVGSEISASATLNDSVGRRMRETVERIRSIKGINNKQNPHIEPSSEKQSLTFFAIPPPVVLMEQEKLKNTDWKLKLQSILARRDLLISLSHGIETELKEIVEHFRNRMGLWNKMQHTFSAFLNVLPATVAVTYVLSTGDPIGAAGIKVKLTGLFGLHDLYALIAIPATSGLKKADQKQLEILLGPIAETWLKNKLKTLHELFEKEITGGLIHAAKDALDESERVINEIQIDIKRCKEVLTVR